jgi:hypothetical protein
MFRNVLVNYPREFNKAPNGDTFLCFMLKIKGELHFIDGVDPGIRVLDIPMMLTPHSGDVDPSVDFGLKNEILTKLQFFS